MQSRGDLKESERSNLEPLQLTFLTLDSAVMNGTKMDGRDIEVRMDRK